MRLTDAKDEPDGFFVPVEDEEADQRHGEAQRCQADHEYDGSSTQGQFLWTI